MRLIELELNNLRSYASERIEFADGVTLFEGDIGSGKSTILYAIEFALFGLGDLKSSFLLRTSAMQGGVSLKFSVGEREYAIRRTLERRKTGVQQASAWIAENGVEVEYSAEEAKKRVLQILGFNENPSPKSTSWIYRYAVFTPQEEMKKVLELSSEERLQTLRKALQIEEYKIAAENTALGVKWLKNEEKYFEGECADLQEWTGKKKNLSQELAKTTEHYALIEKTCRVAQEKTAVAKNTLEAKQKESGEVQALGSQIPFIEGKCSEWKHEMQSILAEIPRLQEDLKKNDSEKLELEARKSDLKDAGEIGQALFETKKLVTAVMLDIGAYKDRINSTHDLINKKKCPTCRREVTQQDFLTHLSEWQKALNQKEEELKSLQVRENTLDELKKQAQLHAINDKRLGELNAMISKNKMRLQEIQNKLMQIQENLPVLEKELGEKQVAWQNAEKLLQGVQEAKEQLEDAHEEEKSLLQQKTMLETQEKELSKQLEDVEKQLEKKHAAKNKLDDYASKRTWLNEYFQPTIALIEQTVLAHINNEFNSLLEKNFTTLIEYSDITVTADENFTPVVTQNGYEQDYRALSGGEKSALALAYRIALNTVVKNALAASEKNENLLILDEPTDGFSKEQLARVRDVLNNANASQILLVSHERELESFADRVHYVEKIDGISRIRK